MPLFQISLIPFAVAILRYAMLVDMGRGSAPEELIFEDPPLLVAAAVVGCGASGSRSTRSDVGEPVDVYTDGACLGNPGRAGGRGPCPAARSPRGAEPHTTNQRMEITAALEAVRVLDGPLEVVSDSTYVVNCFRDRWYEGWLAAAG